MLRFFRRPVVFCDIHFNAICKTCAVIISCEFVLIFTVTVFRTIIK